MWNMEFETNLTVDLRVEEGLLEEGKPERREKRWVRIGHRVDMYTPRTIFHVWKCHSETHFYVSYHRLIIILKNRYDI